jgi:hypothetical protein
MHNVKNLKKYLFLGFILFLYSNISKCADSFVFDALPHEKNFAEQATKDKLVDAYLSKCVENRRLAENLEKVKKNVLVRNLTLAFAVGGVSGIITTCAILGAVAAAIVTLLHK